MNKQGEPAHLPPRFRNPSLLTWILAIVFFAFLVHGVAATDLTVERLGMGLENLIRFFAQAFPPDIQRWESIAMAMLETFEMAIVGTTIGVFFSVPLALLVSRNTTPHPLLSMATRGVVSVMRTVPDLIWALIFIICVGLGPLAGILTIAVDTIAFCTRFFSERVEELDKGPIEALQATGATRLGVNAGAVLPASLPSFVATSLFSVEKAIRSAVVLGLVGAGGIGIELSTSMQLMRYDEALTIILTILVVVITVEQISGFIRRKII